MLPNLLVIGGLKCGTTSLHQYLGAHPEIAMSEPKELDFFVRREDSLGPPGNWHRGLDWYASWFQGAASVRGESSHHYTAHPLMRGVPERAADVIPAAKLIYLVRDPIDRLVSHYVERARRAMSYAPIEEWIERALEDPPASTLTCRSMYFMQVERWLACYPAENILVIDLHDIKDRPHEAMPRVFRFLGVDESFRSPEFARSANPSSERRMPRAYAGRAERFLLDLYDRSKLDRRRISVPRPARHVLRTVRERVLLGPPEEPPTVDSTLRERLEEVFRPDVERLRRHTGQSFASWSV